MTTDHYLDAVQAVLRQTEARGRSWRRGGLRQRLANGVPFRFVGRPVVGPQCVTVSLQVRDQDLGRVLGLADRCAYQAGSSYARVYRDRAVVRVEFTLPPEQWRQVPLGGLRHKRGLATIGQKSLGPVARLGWETPHKAIFGSTQSGKTTLLCDVIISLARANSPGELRLLILNPKNDPILQPFTRLPHLAAPIAVDFAASVALLRFAVAEMDRRRGDLARQACRWVIVVDEVAQLIQARPEAGALLTSLSQMAGGLAMNLLVASQAANPGVFGERGSLAKANFPSRIVFRLPHADSYLATGLSGQHTERLGGRGDSLAVAEGGRVTRIRAALPGENDYEALPRAESEPPSPPGDELAGDAALETKWQVPPEMLAWALVHRRRGSATQLQRHFGGAMTKARLVRDYARALLQAVQAVQEEAV